MSLKKKVFNLGYCKIHQIIGYIQTLYLVEEDSKFFLLDSGCRCDVDLVRKYLEVSLDKRLADLKLVIATHAHPDHCGGLNEFKQLGVQVAGPVGLNNWYQGVVGFFVYMTDIFLTYLVAGAI